MRPQQVLNMHLARHSIIYYRQSTDFQVKNNTGSTKLQEDQIQFAYAYGWTVGTIIHFKDDLGLSGTEVENRPGWQKMIRFIEGNAVGAVFTYIWSRFNRNRQDWEELRTACRKANTLVVVNGRVFNLRDPFDDFQASIAIDIAVLDNATRLELLQGSRVKKALDGFAVSPPPAGFEVVGKNKWVLDREERVWKPYYQVFETYLDLHSEPATVRYFLQKPIELLRRVDGEVIPTAMTQSRIHCILTNAAYRGAYVYGLHHTSQLLQGDPEGWPHWATKEPIRIPGHHPFIVDPATFDKAQEILRGNRRPQKAWSGEDFKDKDTLANMPGAPGNGPGLLQGRIRCFCGCGMFVKRYGVKSAATRRYEYSCEAKYRQCTGDICSTTFGPAIDAVVVDYLLKKLPIPSQETLAREFAAVSERYDGILQSREDKLKAAKEEAERLQREFLAINREKSPDLKASVEGAAQAARAHVKQLELDQAASPAPRPETLTPQELAQIATLNADIREIWNHPLTTNRERKLILRCFLDEVQLTKTDPAGCADEFTVRWKDGAKQSHRTVQPFAASVLIKQFAADGKTPQQALDALINMGITCKRDGAPLTLKYVRRSLRDETARKRRASGIAPWPKRRQALEAPLRELKAAKMTDRDIAKEFEQRGIPNVRGEVKWNASMIGQLREYFKMLAYKPRDPKPPSGSTASSAENDSSNS